MNSDKIASIALAIAALTFSGIMIRRELVPPTPKVTMLNGEESRFEDRWVEMAKSGTRLGPMNAPITLIEYADFECSFCGQFNATIVSLRKRFPTQLNYVFVHWPLNIHRFAVPAAISAECAARQTNFESIAEVLFAKQDSFGLKTWANYAADAGVRDTAAFTTCRSSLDVAQLVDRGVQSAKEMKVRFTPTVILNGWRYGSTPSEGELTQAIESLLAGRKPYPQFPDSLISTPR